MQELIHPSWQNLLQDQFSETYFKALQHFIHNEYESQTCYPPTNQIFASLQNDFERTNVVILGQDPYHNPGQANGYCFSVNDDCSFPPSLRNIFKEIQTDIGTQIPASGNLEHWSKQGVLLLNSVLTVRENTPGSHAKKGWEIFTDAIIKLTSNHRQNVVFMLWGGYAKKKSKLIDASKHLILESGHPSPLSANQGLWFGNKHFSKANSYLQLHDKAPIQW